MDIQGKVAIVTGAASGIGQASAVALAEAGAALVVATDVRADALGETVSRIEKAGARAIAQGADAGELADWEGLMSLVQQEGGGLHILHNNAGMQEAEAGWPGVSPERAGKIVDVNLRGPVLGTRVALPVMQHSGGGAIVATASGAGLMPLPFQPVYAATKAGVIHFTKSCADLAQSHGVRVNCVCPGLVDTPMVLEAGDGEIADWIKPVLDEMGFLRPEQVAEAVLELIRDDSKAGEAVVVST